MLKKDNKPRLKYAFVIILSVIFTAIYYFSFLKQRVCANFDCISFSNKETYQVKEVFTDQNNSFLAEYQNDTSIMRVEIIEQSLEESKSLIKSRIARIQAQYEDSISPYPGEISDSITCPPNFKPEIKFYDENGIDVSSFLTKLNERMITGQCEENLIKYHSYNYYFHCPSQNKTFLIETIYDKNITGVQPLTFSCN